MVVNELAVDAKDEGRVVLTLERVSAEEAQSVLDVVAGTLTEEADRLCGQPAVEPAPAVPVRSRPVRKPGLGAAD